MSIAIIFLMLWGFFGVCVVGGVEGSLSCNKGSGRVDSYADIVVLNEVGGAMANEIIDYPCWG